MFCFHLRCLLFLGVVATLFTDFSQAEEPVAEGSSLIKSPLETEQALPLIILAPDGRTTSFVALKLHWKPRQNSEDVDQATTFSLDNPSDIFLAQLWKASLASALAWQEPWLNAHWQVMQTPTTDGSGLDAGLAVGMIVTSARRAYPQNTIVIGSLNPDGSLGPVPLLSQRLQTAAANGITRVVIPSVQKFETDSSNHVIDILKLANSLQLEVIAANTLVEATEKTMGDPLPDAKINTSPTPYSSGLTSYLNDAATKEETAANNELSFAPREAELAQFPPNVAQSWQEVHAQINAAQQAFHDGHVYAAYLGFVQANARMQALNAAILRKPSDFDLKTALSAADDLRKQLQALLEHPAIDQPDLQSGLLVAEMADWIFSVNAELEGGEMVAKQAYSLRTDATPAEQEQARNRLLDAIEMARYQIGQADFFTNLSKQLDASKTVAVDVRASHYYPQLVPVQLAIAQVFSAGIRSHAQELGDGILYDARLASYIRVMKENKAAWDSLARQQDLVAAVANSAQKKDEASVTAAQAASTVAFDPGNSFAAPNAVVITAPPKTLTDVALCLTWVNGYCEIAELNQKYLELNGELNPSTHTWKIKDKARLESLLQAADLGAQQGLQFAQRTGIDTSILSLIYEHATALRGQNNDAASLAALRNYWRCALLGEMSWQLAFTPKAVPVDMPPPAPSTSAPATNTNAAPVGPTIPVAVVPAASVNPPDKTKIPDAPPVKAIPVATIPAAPSTSGPVILPPKVTPVAPTNAVPVPVAPVAPVAVAVPVTNAPPVVPVAPVAPAAKAVAIDPTKIPTAPVASPVDEDNIPIAPIAHPDDSTNTAPTPPAH